MTVNDGPGVGPLSGLRVLDIGVWHAGPGAAAILGDLGAEVIKIEQPAGDPERHHGVFVQLEGLFEKRENWNMLFEFSNRNKQSLAIDGRTEAGRRAVHGLVKSADVLFTNLRPATRTTLAIDYSDLVAVNPNLIYIAISAFGEQGPLANQGGFDFLGQALSGLAHLFGGSNEPKTLNYLLLDQLTAIAASHAALTALFARERTGKGTRADVSLLGSGMWFQQANLFFQSAIDEPIDLDWHRRQGSPLRTTYQCSDGRWIAGTNNPPERFWAAFCQAIGRQDLLDDPRFADISKTDDGFKALFEILDDIFAQRPRDEWVRVLSDAKLLFAPVKSPQEVLADPQVRANGYVQDFEHPFLGALSIPSYPINFSSGWAGVRTAAPTIGSHSVQLLSMAGFSDAEVTKLIADGSVIAGGDLADAQPAVPAMPADDDSHDQPGSLRNQ